MRNDLWPVSDVEKLLKLWAQGFSAGEISKRFNGEYSRNAVIGMVHRKGLRGRTRIVKIAQSRLPRQRKPTYRKKRFTVPPVQKQHYVTLPPLQPGTPLEHAGPMQCRYIEGSAEEAIICGRDAPEGSSWCSHHRAVVFTASVKEPSGKKKSKLGLWRLIDAGAPL